MRLRPAVMLAAFAIAAGCLSAQAPPSEPATPLATAVASFEQDFRLRETSLAGGGFMHERNCIGIPSTFTLVRGRVDADRSPNSPFTESMTLEALGSLERNVLATASGAPPLHIEFGRVESDPGTAHFVFYLILDHDGQSIDQPATMHVEVEVEGSEAPEFEVMKCAVS